ncbi:MAG: hypothetical protein IJE25_02745 [Clostridia bacterium]|nr:hypothetical protein [Clostridia bacterium]
MKCESEIIVVNNIKLPINASFEEAFSVARKKLSGLVSLNGAEFSIFRRSIDARRKDNIFFVYSVAVKISARAPSEEKLKSRGASLIEHNTPKFMSGEEPLSSPPVVVGSGPAGLFCALVLSELGYKPVLLERGPCVKERLAAVEAFKNLQVLDPNANIQFGAGGAGTFSDGKLVTRVNDPLTSYVLERFVEFGAPSEIKYIAKPHVGTDILSSIVDRMLDRICELGGKVHYNTEFISPICDLGRVVGVKTSKGDIPAGALILAIGHSARDTHTRLISENMAIEAKSFSVGMRIEHLAKMIDESMYGDFAGCEALGHAEYNLSHNTKERGVYTFCMCPGGEVVPAASEIGGVVVNGMSYHSRSGKNSNSAVVCSVFKEDYGGSPLSAIEFQRRIEQAAYKSCSSYSAPIITVGDFLRDRLSSEPSDVQPTYMNGRCVHLASPYDYLPSFVCDAIKGALIDFDKKIHGFASQSAILTGAETRTSSPVRMLRDNSSRLAIGYSNLYPVGEGAGYAGGITSAAIDGIKTAIAVISRYKP